MRAAKKAETRKAGFGADTNCIRDEARLKFLSAGASCD